MSDVRKTVEIALQVVGIDAKNIKSIVTIFTDIQKAVSKTNDTLSSFQKSLNAMKAPKSLSGIIDSLTKLSKTKIPSIANFAKGLQKLGDMKKPPDLSRFVKELLKFSTIKLPGVNALVSGFKKLTEIPVNAVVNRIRMLNTALSELDKKGGLRTFKLFARDVRQLKTAFGSAAASTQKMVSQLNSVGDAAQRSGLRLRTFSDKVRTVLEFRLISEAILQVRAAITTGIQAIIEYDQALKDLQAITGASTLEVAQMGAKILEVASTTKFSAAEIAAGMRTIGQAGFSAAEAVETMQAVSDLATGTLSDMNTTVDLVTTAMRVFGIEATQTSMIADVFANAVNRSKLTVDKLRTAMNYIGPIARDAGVTFKELSASMMTLANSGLRASTIGTGLRRVFAELIDPSKKLQQAARDAGVSLEQLDPRASSLADVMQYLAVVVDDAKVAFDVFGKRGAGAVLALTTTESIFQQMLDTVDRSGTAARQASIQMEGLGVSFKNLKDKLELLAIAFGKAGITAALKILVNVLRGLVDILTEVVDTYFVGFIVKATLVTASIWAMVQALTALAKIQVFASMVTGLTAVATGAVTAKVALASLMAIFTPLNIAIVAVGAAAAIAFSFVGRTQEISDEAAILADKFGILSKKLREYGENSKKVEKDTNKLKETNLAFRKELLETASSFTEISDEARAAAESIDPLEGTLTEGEEALIIYRDALKTISYDSLVTSGKAFNEVVKNQGSFLSRVVSIFKDVPTYVKYLLVDRDKLIDFKSLSDDALEFSKKLNAGKVTFLEFRKEVLSLDLSKKMTGQQKSIIKLYDTLNERAVQYVKYLRETNEISLDESIEEIERIAREAGYSGLVLEAMLFRIKKAQEGMAAYLKKQKEMSFEFTPDLKDQTKNYKRNLKEREAAHALYISSITEAEAKREITEEDAEKKKLNALLSFYSKSLAEARVYFAKVDEETDSDEYIRRQNVVLVAEKKFYQKRTAYLKAFADLNEEYEGAKADNAASISEAVYNALLKKQQEASKTLNTELKAAYDQDLLSIAEYYTEKRDLADEDFDSQADLIGKRIKVINEEYATLIGVTNSVKEQNKLKAEQYEKVLALEIELKIIEEERTQTLNKLSSAEYKATESAKKRSDAILEQIKRRTELSESKLEGTTFEEKFDLEMAALTRKHAKEIIELEKQSDDEVKIAEAKALQLEEIENKTAAHKKAAQDLQLSDYAQFAGNMGSMAKDLVDAGIIRSKSAFKAYKAFAIAETMISTYSSAQSAYDKAMKGGTGLFAQIMAGVAYAAALVKGMATVAQIRSQEMPSFADGGLVGGYSPHSKADNITAKLTAKEFVQPVSAVEKYGTPFMNGLRSLAFPKEAIKNLMKGVTGISNPIPTFALAGGGMVQNRAKSDPQVNSITVDMTNNFTGVDESVSRQMGVDFEDKVTNLLHRIMK